MSQNYEIFTLQTIVVSEFSLKLTKLIARLHFPECELPYWLGNKFRGGFGNVLFKAVCGYMEPKCSTCASKESCLYYELYIRNKQKRGKSQPVRPIVFIPPFFARKVRAKDYTLEIEVNVFGNYVSYLPHIIFGLKFLGGVGLNKNSKYELLEVKDYFTKELVYSNGKLHSESVKTVELSNIAPVTGDTFKIEYITPIDSKIPISLEHLLRMVWRRLVLYVNEYGEGFVPKQNAFKSTILDSKWRKHNLLHYSKRGGKRSFWGYTGYAVYKGELGGYERKLLAIGLLIGAGAKASFGMGHFNLNST